MKTSKTNGNRLSPKHDMHINIIIAMLGLTLAAIAIQA